MHYGFSEKQNRLLSSSIPSDFIDERKQGSSQLSYLTGAYVAELLDRLFDGCWSFKIVDKWIEESVPFANKYGKKDNNGDIIPEPQAPVAHVMGRLEYPLYAQPDYEGEVVPTEPMMMTKDAGGSKVIVGKADQQDSVFKAAGTDALKKAANLLGIARELYLKDNADNIKLAQFNEWINQTLSADNWTPYDMNRFSDEWEKINALHEAFGFKTDEDVTDAVTQFYDETGRSSGFGVSISPDNIKDYLAYLLKIIANSKAVEAE